MNETLSVIDEHITDLNTPRSSLLAGDRRGANDSGSEYSSHIDHRLSYINGHETDEEESNIHTQDEVMKWTPSQVASYLKEIGVESRHCDIFRDEEISGEVLLGMEQASIFMKEFDLGAVGRRLRTWHKIKALQEEIRAHSKSGKQKMNFYGHDASPDEMDGRASRESGSVTGSMLPRISSLSDRHDPKQSISSAHQEKVQSAPQSDMLLSPNSASSQASPPPDSPSRPSAASVRDLVHSRRHSSADFNSPSAVIASRVASGALPSNTKGSTTPHKKQPSFDRSWTMGSSISAAVNARPTSAISTGAHTPSLSVDRSTFDPAIQDPDFLASVSRDLDRGYASGGELESRKHRNVLRKRDVVSANHSRQNSQLEEQRRKSVSGSKRHSRFGSADSIRDTVASVTSPASRIYYGNSLRGRFRTSKAATFTSPTGSSIGSSSPTITNLENPEAHGMSILVPSPKPDSERSISGQNSPLPSAQTSHSSKKPRMGLRAISDAVTGHEKALVTSPSSIPSPVKESPVQSPTRTGSTTTSGASKSFELESTDVSSKGTSSTPTGTAPIRAATRRKPKKQTSAYTRGLQKKTPQEQLIDCDYSGWMKKKSSNLMTTWKPRLFVLRGCRLSYYYTENDAEEKGLIDISSHRVLPADNDLITGIHATVTGAKASPTSPLNSQTPTLASTEAANQIDPPDQKPGGESVFIFKLVPPRTGLSRAVNFTKPTVHYFAVDNLKQGRLWMAALMKATIDRDETKPIVSTYQQKTVSLAKAKAMRQRPPALMGLDEGAEGIEESPKSDETGLNIQGLNFDKSSYGHKKTNSDMAPGMTAPATITVEEEKGESP